MTPLDNKDAYTPSLVLAVGCKGGYRKGAVMGDTATQCHTSHQGLRLPFWLDEPRLEIEVEMQCAI